MLYKIEIRRGGIRDEPNITQYRWYLNKDDFKYYLALKLIYNKEKDEFFKQEIQLKLKKITNGHKDFEIFSDASIYFKAINAFCVTSDGLIISKKVNDKM
jgi:hypothetical protein